MDATPTTVERRQQSMPDFVAAMEKAGLLVRIAGEKRVDELPMLMEQHYDKAIFVERVEGSNFRSWPTLIPITRNMPGLSAAPVPRSAPAWPTWRKAG